jgi:hypothetical protein
MVSVLAPTSTIPVIAVDVSAAGLPSEPIDSDVVIWNVVLLLRTTGAASGMAPAAAATTLPPCSRRLPRKVFALPLRVSVPVPALTRCPPLNVATGSGVASSTMLPENVESVLLLLTKNVEPQT